MNEQERIISDIIAQGGTNPVAVPGFDKYFFTDEGMLFVCRPRGTFRLSLAHDVWYRMHDGGKVYNVSQYMLRYCIQHGISPVKLKECRLSVVKGDDGMVELVDVTEAVRRATAEYHHGKLSDIESSIEKNIRWNTALLTFYKGDTNALVEIRTMMEEHRGFLERYVHKTLKCDSDRADFIIEEVMSQVTDRIINRTGIVNTLLPYMEAVARGVNKSISKFKGRVYCDNNIYHVKGDLSKADRSTKIGRRYW